MPHVDVKISGPVLEGKGPAEVKAAIEETVKDLVGQGERKVHAQLYPGHGLITGHYRRSVHGEITDSLHGRIHDSKVVYGPWLEGVSSRNKTGRFKGYAMFRKAREALNKIKTQVLQKYIGRAVKRLGG